MNNEFIEALNALEKEKKISKELIVESIETALLNACKSHFGKNDNITAKVDLETGSFNIVAAKEVVENVEDDCLQISLAEARMINSSYEIGDIVNVNINADDFGRIAIQNAKGNVLQKIREEEKRLIVDDLRSKEKDVVTGIVQRYAGKNLIINLGKADAILNENEMVEGERYKVNDRVKVYVVEVKDEKKGLRILVSRTHPELVKRLFEAEVAEVRDGTVEIKNVAREAGSRTKIAVWSNNPDVDPVGACVGVNGARVNAVVDELKGEKIDIINWSENPANLIENALSPAKVVFVAADDEEKTAQVVVPDYQLSLAIGQKGQNARLAAKLTGFKIDIKSETQAKDCGLLDEFASYADEDYDDEYDEYDEYSDEE